MNLALRLAVACFVIAAPTLLYLGLLRGLEKLRDDALLMRIAESDEASRDASAAAARAVEKPSIRTDGHGSTSASENATNASGRSDAAGYAPRPESVVCNTCGATNMMGARYCGECLDELDW